MRRIVAGITTLEEHLETIRQKPEVYRPLSCPHCGIKHSCVSTGTTTGKPIGE
jgi:hypothetical protein